MRYNERTATPTSEPAWDLAPLAELLQVRIQPATRGDSRGKQVTFRVGKARVAVEMYKRDRSLYLEVVDDGWSGYLTSTQPPAIDGHTVIFSELASAELYLGGSFSLEAEGTPSRLTLELDLSERLRSLSNDGAPTGAPPTPSRTAI